MSVSYTCYARLICFCTYYYLALLLVSWPTWITWSSVTSYSLNRRSLRRRSFVPIMKTSLTSESVRSLKSQSAAGWRSTVTKSSNFCLLDCLLVRNLCLRIVRFFRGWQYASNCSMTLPMLYLSSTEVIGNLLLFRVVHCVSLLLLLLLFCSHPFFKLNAFFYLWHKALAS